MRYFIVENGKLKEVDESVYDQWDPSEFILPTFITAMEIRFNIRGRN